MLLYSGKVIRGFKDKFTLKRYNAGQVYKHEDEARLLELSKKGFVEYKKPRKKAGGRNGADR